MKRIPLVRDGFVIEYVLVDDEDFTWLSDFTWRLSNKGYATRSKSVNGVEQRILMHREILDAGELQVDHIDRDKLNNQRINLRVVSDSMNKHNIGATSRSSSGVRGVYWDASKNKWRATVYLNRKRIELGRFDDLAKAEETVLEWKRNLGG